MNGFYAPGAPEVLAWFAAHPEVSGTTGHRPKDFPRREDTVLEPLTERFKQRNPNYPKYDPMGLDEPVGELAMIEFYKGILTTRKVKALNAGAALGHDSLITEAGLQLGLPVMISVPFETQQLLWPKAVQAKWRSMLERADIVVCVTPVERLKNGTGPTDLDMELMKAAMSDRNKFMMANGTGPVIAFWSGKPGGTGNAVKQCNQLRRTLDNIYPDFTKQFLIAETSKEPICGFQGEFRWMSNFIPGHPIKMQGMNYETVEAAYQAAKTNDLALREPFTGMKPGAAKQAGKKLPLRADWEQVKLDLMKALIRTKFKDPALRAKLIGTGERQLIESNPWGDVYWGVSKGVGENHLGKILMAIREEARTN